MVLRTTRPEVVRRLRKSIGNLSPPSLDSGHSMGSCACGLTPQPHSKKLEKSREGLAFEKKSRTLDRSAGALAVDRWTSTLPT